jgi:hypothetical protein
VKADPTFAGGAGIADTTHDIYSAIPGPDGVTYVALRKAGGAIGWGSGTLLRRYLANGALDTSFATQGELSTLLVANPQGIGIDGTGRVLVGGTGLYDPDTTSDSGKEIVVVRVTPAGDVDTSYGFSGRAKLSFSAANTWTTALRVLGDGSVFVSAGGRTSGNESFGSYLVNASGQAVSAFGTAGFLSSAFPVDGAYAIGGEVLIPKSGGLVRYGADGKPKGAAIEAAVVAVKNGKDGALTAVVTDGEKFNLARFSSTGKADKTFVGPELSEGFTDFVVLADGGVIFGDKGDLSWVGPKGGAAAVVVKGAASGSLALTDDGKLLATGSGSSAKVLRYTF